MQNTKPVQRVQDAEKSECSGVDPLSQITPWLYLGSHRDALDSSMLASHGIDCVLNTAKECDTEWADSSSSCGDSSGSETPEGWRRHPITYLKLHWTDHADESISQEFPAAFKFIEAARQQGRKVLVHCRRGISRSATLVIAYLMQYVSYGLDDAFSHVRSKRAIINPNLGFVLSLETFARQLGQEPKYAIVLPFFFLFPPPPSRTSLTQTSPTQA